MVMISWKSYYDYDDDDKENQNVDDDNEYQVKPASDVTELELEEVEEVGGQVPAQSS